MRLVAGREGRWAWRFPAFLVFGLLVTFLLCVIFFVPVTVTLDGYSHLYGAHVLMRMLAGDTASHTYFSYNSPLLPNWLTSLVLATLSRVLPGEFALKAMVVLVSAALFGALYFGANLARYGGLQRAQSMILLLPFVVNGYLTMGFYGFLFSSAICILVLGLLLRRGIGVSFRRQCAVACLLLAAYFFHPLPVLLSLLFPFSHLVSVFLNQSIRDWRGAVSVLRRDAWGLWPWAPVIGLTGWFSSRLASAVAPHAYSVIGNIRNRAMAMGRPDAILSISPSTTTGTLFIALLSILAAAALLHAAHVSPENRLRFNTLTVYLLIILVLFMIAPDGVGDGTEIPGRLLLYATFSLALLALTDGALGTRLLGVCCGLAAVSVGMFGAEYMIVSRRLAPALGELHTAMEGAPKGSRILVMSYRMTPSCMGWPLLERTMPERHWAMSAAVNRGMIVLNDYEAASRDFPLQYRPSQLGREILNEVDPTSSKQRSAWTEVLRRSDPDVDFVISWGTPSGISNCTDRVDPPFEEALRVHYDRVLLNQGVSRVAVWRRRI